MLSREDSRRLAELERQLRRDDPDFCARMTAGAEHTSAPSGRGMTLSLIFTAAVIWAAAVVLGVLGWWIAAVIAAFCATVVVSTLAVWVVRRRRRRR
ncbi:DUF3040 domain-containing protein [Actinoplanes sp. CA-030573]|uniref:DUF3040 domain-containing protein n=1 Tax=Actinoplanes sp. CA-030573 TaxID=3239898 RepID=UPI003D8EF99A